MTVISFEDYMIQRNLFYREGGQIYQSPTASLQDMQAAKQSYQLLAREEYLASKKKTGKR